MSKVSRSVYQKLKEENKRLLKDLDFLTNKEFSYSKKGLTIFSKWRTYFAKQNQFHILLKAASKEYIKDHADELPDFLTKNIVK